MMNQSQVRTNVEVKLAEQIDVLTMPPVQRRRVLRDIAKKTRQDVRTNIRKQRTVSGEAMAPRAGKKKKRMFRKMAKGMVTKIVNDHEADVRKTLLTIRT